MVSLRLLSRLSVLVLLIVAGLVLSGAGCGRAAPLAGPERTRATAAALDGPEQVWVERQKLFCNDTLSYSYFGWSSFIDVDQAIVGAYRADKDRGAGYVFLWNGKKWVQQAKLTAKDGKNGDFLGGSVGLTGDTAVVGAPYKSSFGLIAAGAVYVFDRSDGHWSQSAKLTSKDAGAGSLFGWSTAFTGDTIVIGSLPDSINGAVTPVPLEAVYVFERGLDTWTQTAKLTASDGKAGQFFGVSVALEGDTLVVGAPGDSDKAFGSGAAYVFSRSGSTWTQVAKLKASDAKGGAAFGWASAISKGSVVVGAPHASAPNLMSGAAYVFTEGPSGWTEQQQLLPHDPTVDFRVGGSVAIDGDTVLLGRQFYYNQDQDHGAAYVFNRSSDVWTETVKFSKDDAPVGIWFGNSVAVRGTSAFVGAVEYDIHGDEDEGAIYAFALRSVNTVPCADGVECASGFCADGICCDAACDGPCMACTADKKGGGDDGVCEPVADGTDPDSDCKPYTCSGGACLTSCQAATDCAKTFYCDPSRHECAAAPHDVGATASCSMSPGPRGGGSLGLVAALFAAALSARRRSSLCKLTPHPRPLSRKRERGGSPSARLAPPLPHGGRGGWGVRDNRGARAMAFSALLFGLSPAACGGDRWGDALGPVPPRHPQEAPPDTGQGIQIEEQTELFAGGAAQGDWFGASAAFSGDTALIGAPFKDMPGMMDMGSAYVFTRVDDAWMQEAMLGAMDPSPGARFGGAVALSGDTAVVSAPASQVVYVFARSEGAWTQQARLTPGGGAFSGAIAVSADTLIAGAAGDSDHGGNAGAAYLFERTDGVFDQGTKILASDGAEDDRFGASVAVDGDTAAVGAIHADEQDTEAGAAYVFVRADGAWTQQAKLLASDGSVNDNLGAAIGLSGDRVVVGAPAASMSAGSAYVFARDESGAWTEEAKLSAGDGMPGDAFGSSVTIDGDTIVVGAPGSDVAGMDAGAAYVFMRVNGGWSLEGEITSQDAQAGDNYGGAVAASGTTAIVGARLNDLALTGTDVGSAYVLLLGSPAGCIDETHSAAERLPGEPMAAVESCSPRRCDPSTGACRTSCKETVDCAKGFFCDPTKKACLRVPPKDVGAKGCRAAPAEAPSGALPLMAVGLSAGLLFSRSRRRRSG